MLEVDHSTSLLDNLWRTNHFKNIQVLALRGSRMTCSGRGLQHLPEVEPSLLLCTIAPLLCIAQCPKAWCLWLNSQVGSCCVRGLKLRLHVLSIWGCGVSSLSRIQTCSALVLLHGVRLLQLQVTSLILRWLDMPWAIDSLCTLLCRSTFADSNTYQCLEGSLLRKHHLLKQLRKCKKSTKC